MSMFIHHQEKMEITSQDGVTPWGKIRIYAKTIKLCTIFRKKFSGDRLFAYAGNRERAALIHMLLHLKYASDEEKV